MRAVAQRSAVVGPFGVPTITELGWLVHLFLLLMAGWLSFSAVVDRTCVLQFSGRAIAQLRKFLLFSFFAKGLGFLFFALAKL